MELAKKCGNLIIKCILRELNTQKNLQKLGKVEYTLIDTKDPNELQFILTGDFSERGKSVFNKYEIIGTISIYEVEFIRVSKCA